MTAPTHRQYAICTAFIAAMVLYNLKLSEISYYLTLPILILTSKYGAIFPDIDCHWHNIKEKTVPNWIINKLIRLTGGRHRSWQTHSIDIVVVLTIMSYYGPTILYNNGKITNVNKEVAIIILMGFMSGWVSHIIADMLTSAGVRILFFSRVKIALVPKRIGGIQFSTGSDWETFNYKVIRFFNIIIGFICLIYPMIYNGRHRYILELLRR